MSAVGIDFGTTNSVVSVYGSGGAEVLPVDAPPADWAELGFDRVLPSVFAMGANAEPLFGWRAKTRPTAKLEAVKRLFKQDEIAQVGDQTFYVEEVAALLFAHLKRAAADAGVDVSHAVVTIPANSRGLARFRTKVCAGMAGIEVPVLINEPTAAAMAYGISATENQTLMVIDWGGGTLDVTILETVDGTFMEQASKGINKLGGMDFDSRLAKAIIDTIPNAADWSEEERGTFKLAVERAKILLSSQEETNLMLPGGEHRRVTRRMFEEAVRPLIERVREPIERCLADLRETPSDIDAVILVGGTSKIPAVKNFIADLLGSEPVSGVDPMTAVAEGAAVAAAVLSGALATNDFLVSTEHALGTVVLDPDRMELRFDPLIPRNHKLPAKRTETYHPVRDDQDSVAVRVIEGDPTVPIDHEDNVILKEWNVAIPEPGPAMDKAFDMTYDYDADGILHVTVVDGSGNVLLQDDVSFGVTRDKRQLVKIAESVESSMNSGSLAASEAQSRVEDPEAHLLVQRARTKVIPFLDDEQAEVLRQLVAAVERADASSVAAARKALEDELRKYSYLF
jgi:molecular chaperone DnaK (HSP70)